MINQDFEQLTLDTLFERRRLVRGSFANNLAADELAQEFAIGTAFHRASNTRDR